MNCKKKYDVLNHISTKRSVSTDTPISEGEREVTGGTIIWKGHRSRSAPSVLQGIGLRDLDDGQNDSVSAVENRSSMFFFLFNVSNHRVRHILLIHHRLLKVGKWFINHCHVAQISL